MRLGELLVQRGVITPEQLQTSLHEQRRFGGRLGTNLLQLGYVAIDTLAMALGVQQGLSPVLREHVASIDPRMLAMFSAKVVSSYKAIPIGYTATKPARVVVACIDPAAVPIDELAFAAGSRIEMWIAPEALMQELLEKHFGAPPMPLRYVSVDIQAQDTKASLASLRLTNEREAIPAPPAPPPPAVAERASVPSKAPPVRTQSRPKLPGLSPPPPPPPPPASAALPRLSPPPPPPTFAMPRELEPPPSIARVEPAIARVEPAIARVEPAIARAEPAIRDVVLHVAEEAPRAPPASMESDPEMPDPDEWDLGEELPHEPPPPARPVTAPPDALRPVISLAQASMLMEMATSKDQIGRALEDWLRSAFGCGLVLVVKGDMALGWKGFFPDAEDLVEAVTVHLDKPSMFSLAHDSRAVFRGPPPAEGAKQQERLWKLLRCAPPADALVAPVVLGKRTVNLVYAHMEDGSPLSDAVVEEATTLCGDAAAAYARLIARGRAKK